MSPLLLLLACHASRRSSQCFTLPGFGRVSSRGENGQVVLSAVACPLATYNVGGNTAGCQACPPGLTTAAVGANSTSNCVAPAGSYLNRGVGTACPKGTFTTDLNRALVCTPCPDGLTTASEGSSSPSACSLAMKGFSMNADGVSASPCPVNTFSDAENAATSCTPCPNAWRTRDVGATGPALCLAPPGYELREGASAITECDVGFWKDGWNRAPCVACGTNLDTEGTGAVSRDACRVPPGFGVVSLAPLAVRMCTDGTYGAPVARPATFSARCVSCPANTATNDTLTGVAATSGWTSEAACLLRPGWGTTATMPERCQLGSWNAGGNRLPCTACPSGYTTLQEGSTLAEDCVVQPGW